MQSKTNATQLVSILLVVMLTISRTKKNTTIFDPLSFKLSLIDLGGDLDIYDFDRSLVAKYREEFTTITDKRYSLITIFTKD